MKIIKITFIRYLHPHQWVNLVILKHLGYPVSVISKLFSRVNIRVINYRYRYPENLIK